MRTPAYIAIDLKSYYASVECVERRLDPLTTNLVVADRSRTEKTICLAVSPSLKNHGIPGRPRLFEVSQKVKEINAQRQRKAPERRFTGASTDAIMLEADPGLSLDYIVAPPRMGLYMKRSTEIYKIYLKYIAPEDIHVYSIDEVFIDATNYLPTYKMTARELAMTIILDILNSTGITATAGIGTNLYLCKIAMDIGAKHIQPDQNGVRIAELDEQGYRKTLWTHTPITDFWRVGKGYARKLEEHRIYTMGDVARLSVDHEETLYQLFGVNAELLIDHAWGWEPCQISDIKAYKPQSNSLGAGQVLTCPYTAQKARIVVREMAEGLALDLVDKELATDQVVLTIGYDAENLKDPTRRAKYKGPVTADHYGRQIPKHDHGTNNLSRLTSSTALITKAAMDLYDRIVNPELLIRRLNLTVCHVVRDDGDSSVPDCEQLDLFTDQAEVQRQREQERLALEREKRMQKAMLSIKHRFGKNAILKGASLQDGATAIERNQQIGGHRE